jgi:hypothetical protein
MMDDAAGEGTRMNDPNAKRSAERVAVPGQVTGEVTVFQPMTIVNISIKGMLMEAAAPLHNDSLHDFRLSLDGRSVIVKGRVVYCKIGELREGGVLYRCGVEFVEPAPHAQAALADFVAVHKGPPAVIDGEVTDDA